MGLQDIFVKCVFEFQAGSPTVASRETAADNRISAPIDFRIFFCLPVMDVDVLDLVQFQELHNLIRIFFNSLQLHFARS